MLSIHFICCYVERAYIVFYFRTIYNILVECNHFAQEMKDIFGSRNVVESFGFHPH